MRYTCHDVRLVAPTFQDGNVGALRIGSRLFHIKPSCRIEVFVSNLGTTYLCQ